MKTIPVAALLLCPFAGRSQTFTAAQAREHERVRHAESRSNAFHRSILQTGGTLQLCRESPVHQVRIRGRDGSRSGRVQAFFVDSNPSSRNGSDGLFHPETLKLVIQRICPNVTHQPGRRAGFGNVFVQSDIAASFIIVQKRVVQSLFTPTMNGPTRKETWPQKNPI
jgi:hypothetical protein